MRKSNEDCFYFLTSSCTKGSSCPFRHHPFAMASNVVCPAWIRGNCLDATCSFRHSNAAVQRPTISNGILCFYENTPMGCLKPDCTFIHSRPRNKLSSSSLARPPSMNLVNKDTITPTGTPTKVDGSHHTAATAQPITSEAPSISVNARLSPCRTALPSSSEHSDGNTDEPDNQPKASFRITHRSVITASSLAHPNENTTSVSPLVASRNVILTESVSVPSRTIVPKTSSNRVVVSSATMEPLPVTKKSHPSSDLLIEQENKTKRLKVDSPSTAVIPAMDKRLTVTPSKQIPPVKSTTPSRLDRPRLPAAKLPSGNFSTGPTSSPIKEKILPGTGLTQDDARRTSRLERFKTKSVSPPQSGTLPTHTSNAANAIPATVNGHKRAIPETIRTDSPAPKRVSIKPFPQKGSLSETALTKSQPTTSSAPLPSKPVKIQRIQPPPSSAASVKPSTSMVTASQTPTKAIDDHVTAARAILPSTASSIDDENQLLTLDESINEIDTFALIDEALLEADHLLELI